MSPPADIGQTTHRERTDALLAQRPSRPADHAFESDVLRRLSAAMAERPGDILDVLTAQTLELCDAGSAGISLLRENGETSGFYWPAIAGAWSTYAKGGMPRDASPCGHVIDEDASLLFVDPERDFPAIEGVEPRISEVLLAPFHVEGRPVGTVWALQHDEARSFDREDRRRLESLANFAASAYQAVRADHEPARESPDPRESARIDALHALHILDTPAEPQFDGVAQLASRICRTPVALVSLVESDRQWFKAAVGFDACETPISQSVCAHAIRQDEILIIPDLTQDARTRHNTLVSGAPHIRFYAGAVLRTSDGHALGALCVIDDKPRPEGLSPEQADSLIILARQTVTLIELRRAVGLRDVVLVNQHRTAADVAERLRTAESRMRTAQSAAQLGAFEVEAGSERMVATEEFARIFGLDPADSYSFEEMRDIVLPEDRDLVSSRQAIADGALALTAEYRIRRRSDGALRWVLRRGTIESDGEGRPRRMLGIVEDITERKQAEARTAALVELGDALRDADSIAAAVAASTRLLGETLGATRTSYATIDPAAEMFVVIGRWPADDGRESQYPFADVPQAVRRLARGEPVVVANVPAAAWLETDRDILARLGTKALIAIPLLGKAALEGVLFVHADAARAWNPDEVAFTLAVADRTHATVAKLQAQAEQLVLNLELAHRLKNTMAVVQSIAQMTLRAATPPDVLRDFDQRLSALGRAHEVLLGQSWVSARLRVIAEATVDLHGARGRVELAGPELNLNARAALTLSLLLHELATNAVKHGALSNDTGRVRMSWSIDGVAPRARLDLIWRESGGPPVVEPTRRGFGSRLLRSGFGATGTAMLTYPSCGLVAEFSVPVSQIVDA